MGIRAVFWDIGGVLVRTEDRTPRLRLAEELGLTYAQLEDAVFNAEAGQKAQVGLLSAEEVWRQVAQKLGLPERRIPALQEAFFGGDVLDEGLVAAIRGLRPSYATGIISNTFDTTRRLLAEVWGIADAFDAIVISAEVGVIKPDPRIYRLALDQLGVAPAEAVFVDDFKANAQGARRVGMHAIHFRSPEQALKDLQALLEEGHSAT
jgi:putative hydrolase of the HAD superfamily